MVQRFGFEPGSDHDRDGRYARTAPSDAATLEERLRLRNSRRPDFHRGDHGPSDALFDAKFVIPFLGLDDTGLVDPEVAKCKHPGNGGSGGMGGMGGMGSGGAGGMGGAQGGATGSAGAAGASSAGGPSGGSNAGGAGASSGGLSSAGAPPASSGSAGRAAVPASDNSSCSFTGGFSNRLGAYLLALAALLSMGARRSQRARGSRRRGRCACI